MPRPSVRLLHGQAFSNSDTSDDEGSSFPDSDSVATNGESSRLPQNPLPDWARPLSITDQMRHFKAKWFKTWRSIFRYDLNPQAAEHLELSFRAAFILMLYSIPKVWGLVRAPEFPFHHIPLTAPMTLYAFVFTMSTSMGTTIGYAVEGVTGTVMAALMSGVMYLIKPYGCQDESSGCLTFGLIFGILATISFLLLNVSTNFHVFYVSNFVFFWMEFMRPGAVPVAKAEERFFAPFPVFDWGGGAVWACITMSLGACMAIVATLLPYPIMALDTAKDSAARMVGVLGEAWFHLVEFHLADDPDEMEMTGLHGTSKKLNHDFGDLRNNLRDAYWEQFIGWRCTERRQYVFLTQFEVCLTRCIRRLEHAINVCNEESFCDVHDEIIKENNCGRAIRAQVKEANLLLRLALLATEDGQISEEEEDNLNTHMDNVCTAERELTDQAVKVMLEIMARPDKQDEEVFQTLMEEQALIFTLCDFSATVCEYCKWIIAEQKSEKKRGIDLMAWTSIFNCKEILSPSNLNFTLRYALSIIICWGIGFYGYSEMIKSRDAGIASVVALLLSQSPGEPLKKGLTRLQGVLGILFGRLVYALFGWCFWPSLCCMSALLFLYVFCWEYVYLSGSSYSSLGLISLIFGAKELIVGCSAEVVKPGAIAHIIMNMTIALVVVVTVDTLLSQGRPSDHAYKTYLKAWDAWENVLKEILEIGEIDTSICRVEPQSDEIFYKGETLVGLLAQAERFAEDAKSEPRIWREAFPSALFNDMIDIAREIRTGVVCISSVIFVSDSSGACEKKAWFKRAMAEEGLLIRKKLRVLRQMAATYDEVASITGHIEDFTKRGPEWLAEPLLRVGGGTFSGLDELASPVRRATGLISDSISLTRDSDAGCALPSFIQREHAQKNFVFFCLDRIQKASRRLHLELRRHQWASQIEARRGSTTEL